MEEKNIEIIKEVAKDLLKKMGFDAEVEIRENTTNEDEAKNEENGSSLICDIKVSDNPNLLIGQYGANIQSLQHITRLIVRKKTEARNNFIVDINSYRQQKTQLIITQANAAAEQAINEKRAVILQPMSAYERRLIHMELAKNDKVITESSGEGEERKVIVRPSGNL